MIGVDTSSMIAFFAGDAGADVEAKIGVRRSPGAYGVGRQFAFPFLSVETVVPLGKDRYLLANDNNYPGNDARYPGRPDDTEMIVVQCARSV